MNFCPNCGNKLEEGSNFCSKCGTSINTASPNTENNNANNNIDFHLPERNIAMSVIFSILTCGLYGIYWFICLTDEVNAVSEENDTTGGMAFLFSILTCGIYGIYWAYRIGQKLNKAGVKNHLPIGDNAILYLILQVFGFGIINYCLMQNELNRFSK